MSEIRFPSPNTNEASNQTGYPVAPNTAANTVGNLAADIDLMHYYRLLMRNLWKIILFSLVIGGFAALYALSLPPIYYSKTTLLIENQQPNVLSFQDVYQVDTRNRNYFGTQIEILRSRSIAERVVDQMNLMEHPLYGGGDDNEQEGEGFKISSLLGLFRPQSQPVDEEPSVIEGAQGEPQEFTSTEAQGLIESDINPADDNFNGSESFLLGNAEEGIPDGEPNILDEEFEAYKQKRKKVVEAVMESLWVYPVGRTQLIAIQVSAQDAQLAADITNAFADVYIESHLEAKLEVTQKASVWLSERLGELRQTLRESEQALQDYREQERLVDTGDVRSIDVAELEQLTQGLVEATQKKVDAQTLYRQMVKDEANLDRMLALPTVAENVVVQNLIESLASAKRKVAELSERYREKHPQMISAVSDVNQVEEELRQQVSNVARGVEVGFIAARDAEFTIKQQIAQVKQRLQGVNRKEFALRELEREVEANRQVYEVFLSRGKETNEAGNLESVNARVVDMALPADYPEKPEKKKIVAVAIIFSGFFAVAVILLLDWLDNTIKTPEDVEDRLRVPLLGHLPLDKENKSDTPFLGFLSEDNWSFSEAVRTIRTSFILSGLDNPAKITLVTSSVPNEGKSTVSLCLAQALGQMEKVVLIDADMRRPSIGKALDISLLTPGLSNLISGTATIEECVTRLPNTEVDIITAGVVLGNPLDQMAGDRFSKVLSDLKEKYDRVIIDSAPIQAVSDSIVIATHADALIYVVKSDGSPTPVIRRGLRRLSETRAKFSGVVLNQVDLDKMKKTSGYESEYYENYGYSGPET